jgi:hypothetical protein
LPEISSWTIFPRTLRENLPRKFAENASPKFFRISFCNGDKIVVRKKEYTIISSGITGKQFLKTIPELSQIIPEIANALKLAYEMDEKLFGKNPEPFQGNLWETSGRCLEMTGRTFWEWFLENC